MVDCYARPAIENSVCISILSDTLVPNVVADGEESEAPSDVEEDGEVEAEAAAAAAGAGRGGRGC